MLGVLSWRPGAKSEYAALGLPATIVQDNLSWSHRHVLRGLHFQNPGVQAKVVQVLAGQIFDVAVDIRRGSPDFGRWVGLELSADNRRQLYIPEGFAHGFCVISDGALVAYKCTAPYQVACELGIAWDDSGIGISWPISSPLMSPKDACLPRLAEIPLDQLPGYEPLSKARATHGA